MNTLHEKVATLPPSFLPKMERLVDSFPKSESSRDNDGEDVDDESNWENAFFDKNGKKVHPKAGCLKGLFVMHDNFFEPDDDWEEYM